MRDKLPRSTSVRADDEVLRQLGSTLLPSQCVPVAHVINIEETKSKQLWNHYLSAI